MNRFCNRKSWEYGNKNISYYNVKLIGMHFISLAKCPCLIYQNPHLKKKKITTAKAKTKRIIKRIEMVTYSTRSKKYHDVGIPVTHNRSSIALIQ
jgi:hypothetical protein